jgi:hypothetical protein
VTGREAGGDEAEHREELHCDPHPAAHGRMKPALRQGNVSRA